MLTALVALLLSLPASAAQNSVSLNINAAKNYMLQSLSQENPNWDGLSPEQAKTIQELKPSFLQELQSSPITLQNETEAFSHFGQETWIETDLQAHGEIRIRPKALERKNPKKLNAPLFFVHFISHEVGHHLALPQAGTEVSAVDESKAWDIAIAFEKFILAQSKTPSLFQLPLGNYRAAQPGCRDQLEIVAIEPFQGLIRVKATTSEGHCRFNLEYTMDTIREHYSPYGLIQNIVNLKKIQREQKENRYPYDSVTTTLSCKSEEDGTLSCADAHPEIEYRYCPDTLKRQQAELSEFKMHDGARVFANWHWCGVERKMFNSSFETKVMYSAQPN